MNQKEYELIAGAIWRVKSVNSMERNKIKRQAREDATRLLIIDLTATFKHHYPKTFDEAKFKLSMGA